MASKWMTEPVGDEGVDRIMRLGYYVRQFTPEHFQFQDRVDYWPRRQKWFDYRARVSGQGVKALIAHLVEVAPFTA